MSKEKADISMLSGQNDQLSTDTVKWERSRVARSKKTVAVSSVSQLIDLFPFILYGSATKLTSRRRYIKNNN